MMQGRGKAVMPGAAAVIVGALLIAGALSCGGAQAADIVPHHAVYSMSLGATHGDAGVTGAGGTMAYQWGEVCDGWTVEQRYRLKMAYAESSDVSISSNFVTWEAKDGLKYRFNQKETRNGTDNDEIRGEAKLDGPDKGGTVNFEKPEAKTLKLPAGTLFPSAHTISLIDKAKAGENFISKLIFDGATMENSVLVTAVIGAKVEPDEESAKKSPLLNRPGWTSSAWSCSTMASRGTWLSITASIRSAPSSTTSRPCQSRSADLHRPFAPLPHCGRGVYSRPITVAAW